MSPTERQDRKGIALLVVLLTLVMLAVWWAVTPDADAPTSVSPTTTAEASRTATHGKHPHTWHLRPFDPNTATEAELRDIGFSDYHVRNLLRYRAKGGVWRSVAHFAKLYGLSPEDYERLRPYLLLPSEEKPYDKANTKGNDKYPDTAHHYTPRYEVVSKLQAGQTIDLATADTTLLKQIPGVGSTYAKRIVRYRERLGGFTHVEQLHEIPDLPAEVADFCTLSHTHTQPLNANSATYGQLMAHPYLNEALVRTIINYRQQYGAFCSVQQLLKLLPISPEERERLRPYLTTNQ